MAEIEHPPTETSEEAPPNVVEAERLISLTLVLGIVAALVALAVVSWLAEEMLQGETATFDRVVSAAVHSVATPALTEVMWFASRFGGPSRLSVIAVILFAVFVWKRWFRGVVLLLVTLGGAGLLDVILKLSFQRERPNPLFDYPLPASFSFPSGHALFSFVFFGSAAVLLADRIRSHALRVIVFVVAAVVIGLIGISRIYLNVHHPSDVVAGYLVALVWIVAVAFGDHLASRGIFRRRNWRKLIRV
ncbi:MAG TPA: phosphatase PAP2 family protein [Gemmatimonadales bacterium]|nr:phosphatase PAP2 family protein [Gemmatimonadales bacterium]